MSKMVHVVDEVYVKGHCRVDFHCTVYLLAHSVTHLSNRGQEPINEDRLISSSSVDILRIIYEVVSIYKKIDWPDREANEERLFQLLADVGQLGVTQTTLRISDHDVEKRINVFVSAI